MPLRFHWSLSQVGDRFRGASKTIDMKGLLSLETQGGVLPGRRAEWHRLSPDAFGFTRPDPVPLSAALGMNTHKLKFMIACRPGVMSPTVFVQQINTVSALTNGRVHINILRDRAAGFWQVVRAEDRFGGLSLDPGTGAAIELRLAYSLALDRSHSLFGSAFSGCAPRLLKRQWPGELCRQALPRRERLAQDSLRCVR